MHISHVGPAVRLRIRQLRELKTQNDHQRADFSNLDVLKPQIDDLSIFAAISGLLCNIGLQAQYGRQLLHISSFQQFFVLVVF